MILNVKCFHKLKIIINYIQSIQNNGRYNIDEHFSIYCEVGIHAQLSVNCL